MEPPSKNSSACATSNTSCGSGSPASNWEILPERSRLAALGEEVGEEEEEEEEEEERDREREPDFVDKRL